MKSGYDPITKCLKEGRDREELAGSGCPGLPGYSSPFTGAFTKEKTLRDLLREAIDMEDGSRDLYEKLLKVLNGEET